MSPRGRQSRCPSCRFAETAGPPGSSRSFLTAEELVVTIGLKPGNADPARHLDTLKNLSSSRIDSSQITVITFPGRMPELSIDPVLR